MCVPTVKRRGRAAPSPVLRPVSAIRPARQTAARAIWVWARARARDNRALPRRAVLVPVITGAGLVAAGHVPPEHLLVVIRNVQRHRCHRQQSEISQQPPGNQAAAGKSACAPVRTREVQRRIQRRRHARHHILTSRREIHRLHRVSCDCSNHRRSLSDTFMEIKVRHGLRNRYLLLNSCGSFS